MSQHFLDRDPEDGYLALHVGDHVVVDFVPQDGEEDEEWLYGRHVETSHRGWFPASAVGLEAAPTPTPISTTFPPAPSRMSTSALAAPVNFIDVQAKPATVPEFAPVPRPICATIPAAPPDTTAVKEAIARDRTQNSASPHPPQPESEPELPPDPILSQASPPCPQPASQPTVEPRSQPPPPPHPSLESNSAGSVPPVAKKREKPPPQPMRPVPGVRSRHR